MKMGKVLGPVRATYTHLYSAVGSTAGGGFVGPLGSGFTDTE